MSLNWHSIKSELTNNFVTLATAPALCLLTLLIGIYIYGIEQDSRENIIDTNVITINSERSVQEDSQLNIDELQEAEAAARTAQFNESLQALLLDSSRQSFSLKKWLIPKQKSSKASDYRDFLIYAAKKTTQQEEFELANELFAEIGRKYFKDDLTGFYRAYALDQVDNYRLAKRTYEWQLERHPNHQSSAMNYGLLLLNNLQRNQQGADSVIQALQHAVSITSGKRKAKSLRFLARAYLIDKQYDESIKTIRRSILFEPDNSQGWTFLAKSLAYSAESDPNEILDAHKKAIALSPNNYRPYLAQANYQFSQLHFDAARETYSKVNQFNKSKLDAKLQEGMNLLASGRPYSAKELFSQLTDLKPEQDVIVKLLKYSADKEFDKASSLLVKAKSELKTTDRSFLRYIELMLSIHSNKDAQFSLSKNSSFERGDMYYWPSKLLTINALLVSEQTDKALIASEELVQSLPKSSEALLLQARTLLKGSKKSEALPVLLKAHSLQPNSRRIGIAAAELLHSSNNHDKAIQVLDVLLENEPRYARAVLFKAKLLIEKRSYKKAKTVLNAAIKMDEKNIQALYLLATVQKQEGDEKMALMTLKELLSIESANVAARLLKVSILAGTQKDAALKELERVLKLEPDNEQALALKDELLGVSKSVPKDSALDAVASLNKLS